MADLSAWDETHTSYTIAHGIICRGTCLCFAFAFASLLLQYDGLFGQDGIEPAHLALHVQPPPNLLLLAPRLGLDVDTLAHVLCWVGFSASSIGTVAPGNAVWAAVTAAWACYLSMFKIGQTFLSFQWDLLLLEVGALAAVYAVCGRKDRCALWALRFCLFKLMFMSGVVKIQANCRTWLELTALEFHYATQCIPTPVAWFAHQMPPSLQQLSVAACLVIEIVLPFALLSPLRCMRVVGAAAQVVLQLLILLTGNYNFFNLLTLLLCFSCFDDNLIRRRRVFVPMPGASIMAQVDRVGTEGVLKSIDGLCGYLESSLAKVALWVFAMGAAVLYASFKMFQVSRDTRVPTWIDQFRFRYSPTVGETSNIVDAVLPWTLLATALGLGLVCLHTVTTAVLRFVEAPSHLRRLLSVILVILASMCVTVYFVASAVTFTSISKGLKLPQFAVQAYQLTQPLHITAGYGLFRRMTGVGPDEKDEFGRKVTTVARPEIIIEVSIDNGKTWHEVNFAYKPGRVDRRPPIVAPHQPRLDWQMWFAALGPYQQSPWFIHLLYKILAGSPDVLALLDPDNPVLYSTKPKLIRARRYTYDFTRWPGLPWNQRSSQKNANLSHWWIVTSEAEEFIPVLDLNNPSLPKFLKEFGWGAVDRDALARQRNCSTWNKQVYIGPLSNLQVCQVVQNLRERRLSFEFFLSVIAALAVAKGATQRLRTY